MSIHEQSFRISKFGFALSLVLALVLGWGVAQAVPQFGARYNSYFQWAPTHGEFTLKPFSEEYNPKWNEALDLAVHQWNNTSELINIKVDANSNNEVGFGFLDEVNPTTRALYQPDVLCIIDECNFTILIDDKFQKYADDGTIMSLGTFLLTHEIGHALGLADIPDNFTVESVMSYNRDYTSLTPTNRDIALVEERLKRLGN